MRTFYEILGVSDNATQDEILFAYRKKVVENHPDKGGDAIEFMNIRKAYQTLSNPTIRTKYDLWLAIKIAECNKARWFPFMQSFIRIICKNETLALLIAEYLANEDNISIYKNLNGQPSNIIAAGLIKECLNTIRNKRPELFKQCLELDTICNDIILGKSSPEIINNKIPERKAADDTMTSKGCVIAAVAVLFIIGGIILFNSAMTDNEKQNDLNNNTSYSETFTDTVAADYVEDTASVQDYEDTHYDQPYPVPDYDETVFETGDVPYREYFGNGKFTKKSLSELCIINFSQSDAVVLLETLAGDVIRNNFVGKGSKFVMKQIPSRVCRVKVMFGNSWYSEKDNGESFPKGGFMKNVSFMEPINTFDFNTIREEGHINYPAYSITLHTVQNGNMQTVGISKEDFFKK